MIIYLNGEFVDGHRATVPVDDAGFLHGVGVYETVLIRKGRAMFWESHWNRLCSSADALEIEMPMTFARATQLLRELMLRNDLADAIARLHLTGDDVITAAPTSRAEDVRPRPPRTVLLRLDPAPVYGPEEVLRGWKAILSRLPYTPFLPNVKHTSRLPHVLARRDAARAHAREAILIAPDGTLLEGTRSSVFFCRGGVLYTPALECGILAGVTREKVLLVAGREGMTVNEGVHSSAELTEAEEVFLSFTSAGIMPVTDVDGRPVGRGRPGPATRRLRSAYEQLLSTTTALAPALV